MNQDGVIVAQSLTESDADDAATALDLIASHDGDLASLTADGAYDTSHVYEAAVMRGAKVVIPPLDDSDSLAQAKIALEPS